ncbi:DUF3349 domain-containing protein [Nocardioides sp. BP30]|uniref:DUF3349 domain-containing protein n=1 Tax=Nocardioides sp. BP30 TaxID=3036374 RepID=UPI002468D0FE|nr:DUF3349 domain-containing protein [Nocardioides sp. BP30]WGL53593.1 DUF3349 domain-containing protein [Nocardioides sp. BP30]
MSTSPVSRVLEWLKAGYPQGIPPADYPPVLGVLRRKLTDEEIEAIADELALQSVSAGDVPVTAEDIRSMVRSHAFQRCTSEDLTRVSGLLASGGWPLEADLG